MCARSTHTRVCILLKHSIYGVGMRGKSLHGEAKNVLDDGKKTPSKWKSYTQKEQNFRAYRPRGVVESLECKGTEPPTISKPTSRENIYIKHIINVTCSSSARRISAREMPRKYYFYEEIICVCVCFW